VSDDKVIGNAKRLMRDAVLLKDHERYASAYALAILGLEEIGKVILKRWGLPDNEGRWHLPKQMAVASLLVSEDLLRRIRDEASDLSQLTPEVFLRAARAVGEAKAGRFSAAVTSKELDKWKQFALYNDGELADADFHANQITRTDVEFIFKTAWIALNIINDNATMPLAKDLFLARREQLAKKETGK
jgi:AbiV family abortive infection protein